MSDKYGIIGYPVGQSLSPNLHNAGFKKYEIDAKFSLIEVKDLATFNFRDYKGLSVTIPHKENVMEFLDEIDPIAKEIGAVNTVMNNGKLTGYNTDYIGFLKPLETIKTKKVVILGAGGAARAIVYALKGKQMTILNRSVERARNLALKFNCQYGNLNELDNLEFDLLVNTTSVGLNDNESLVSLGTLEKNKPIVYDIIYNPIETKLIKEAKETGCHTISGFEMFIYQAAEQFKIWTGKEMDTKFYREIVEKESS